MNGSNSSEEDFMRDTTEKEIRDFIEVWTWGTLIGVEGDQPYAIENTYGSDGKYIYCGSMPGGRMARCIKKNSRWCIKFAMLKKTTRNGRR